MSMPVIKASNTTQEQAITDLIESIALEQTGLSHIINAEGEKIQAALVIEGVTTKDLLDVNKSVECTVNAISKLELVLQSKLEIFKNEINSKPSITPDPGSTTNTTN
ncbi:hypothetical protein SAMN02745196_01710 [Clostridium collagenovorans DSM 3089]|uniref:Uncharacterized protein n=1 Tax=Clostridium collagenovorans DSM 3089 TaxID=1121306 RepID=A0A1M5WKP7_9CLOT|nr:hypothetical protein [Clostridium collagenovorans]SHH88160.1 hypothetical protein SAMN02745196_01710 [Clostridium collagenovorans DSM 3089]